MSYDASIIHFQAKKATKALCGEDGARQVTSAKSFVTCSECRPILGMPALYEPVESEAAKLADSRFGVQRLILEAEENFTRLEILVNHHRQRYQSLVDEVGAEDISFTIYEWQDENGNFVLAPILAAQAQSLHTIALLRSEVMKGQVWSS